MESKLGLKAIFKIADSIKSCICLISDDGYFLYLNNYWQELLGWTIEELKSKPLMEFIHPDDINSTKDAASAILTEQKDLTLFRNRYVKKNGGYAWIEWKATPSDAGTILASGLDVTERVLIEHQNSVNIRQLEQACTIAKMGYWSIDLKQKTLYWSDAVFSIHGVTRAQYTPEIATAIEFYHPEDIDGITQVIDEAITQQKSWQVSQRIVRADGEVRHVLSKAEVSVDAEGGPNLIFGVFQDITEQVQLTERIKLLSKVAETTSTGVVITDSSRRLIWANIAFSKLTGYAFDELQGLDIGKKLQGELTSQETVKQIREGLNKGENIDVDIVNYDKNGAQYWINLLISPIFIDEKLSYYIGFQQDISKRKEQELVIASAQRRDAVNHLAAGICHDFNNILSIIGGNIELIKRSNTDESLTPFVDRILTSADRGAAITQRLLQLTKQSVQIPNQRLNIDTEVHDVCSLMSKTIPSNITINLNLNANTHIIVNKDDLIDCLINIVINASKSIEHHGTITVSTALKSTYKQIGVHIIAAPKNAEKYICLSIHDTGCGIPITEIANIFTPFYSKRDGEQGSGLGLSLLYDFVIKEKLGLTLKSQLGIGSDFCLWFPIEAEIQAVKSQVEKKEVITLKDKIIVLIDDEKELLELNSMSLNSYGARTHAFVEPLEALKFIQQHSKTIDIVISDQSMPGELQGSDIAAIINDIYQHIPCIILSGNLSDKNLENVNTKILSKPIKREALVEEILKSLK